ncbi:hypothetical protein ACWEJ6_48400 [Nonomuraea sp. NPDC004702]
MVDERHRLPIGQPCLTAAFDVASRFAAGLAVTLKAPSALSAGLCLAYTVCDNRWWLERLGVEADACPMSGKPRGIHVDNATEFRGQATLIDHGSRLGDQLRRGRLYCRLQHSPSA